MVKIEKTLLKKLISTSVSLVAILSALIFSVTSFAWFSQNKNAVVTGMTVTVECPDVTNAVLNVYPVTTIDDETGVYTYITSVKALEIPPYDSSNILINEYEKAVVFELVFTSKNVKNVRFSCKTVNGTYSLNDEIVINNYLSNVIEFHKTNRSGEFALTEANNVSFFTDDSDLSTKTTEISFDLTAFEGQNAYYFIVDYNETLLNKVFTYLLGNSTVSTNESVYIDDLQFVLSEGDNV